MIATAHDAAEKTNQPVEFYGKIIDQDSNPIPGVKVKVSVKCTHELRPGTAQDEFHLFELTTDMQGRFTLANTQGSVLSLTALEKDGYEPAESALRKSYWYWSVTADRNYTPHANEPEAFRMWKKAGAERLLRHGISAGLKYDGTPTLIDLGTGEVGAHGDLRVTLVRTPQELKHGQRNSAWTLTLEIPEGGLLETKDEPMYLAPPEGYKPRLAIQQAVDDPQWTDTEVLKFYFRLRGNRYARAEVKAILGSERATTPFYITVFLNPSGSRNLEYDVSKQLPQ